MTDTSEETGTQDRQAEPMGIGRTLAAARERLGFSVADVARQLRLGAKQIESLEAEDYVSLPGNTFVRGFIRNYARLLQIDPEPLLQSFQQSAPSEAHAVSAPPRGGEFSIYPSKRWMWYASAVALMVVAAPLLVYFFLSREDAQPVPAAKPAQKAPLSAAVALPQPVPSPPVQQPAPLPVPLPVAAPQPLPAPAQQSAADAAKPAEQPPAPAGSSRVVFKFDGESWVEVRDKDGNKLFSQLNTAGSEQTVTGAAPFTLVVGNAAHVRATYNGAPVDLTPYINVDVARLTLK